MKKRFKAKTKIKSLEIIKWLVIIIMFILIFKYFSFWNINYNKYQSFFKFIIKNKNYAYIDEPNESFISDIFNYTDNLINEPVNLLATNFYYKTNETKVDLAVNDYSTDNQVVDESNNENTNETEIDKPVIYIYNSHQTEEYSMEYLEDYNIKPTVQMAAYMLKERFDKLGLYTIVEQASISEYLNKNKMKYYQSYEASRYYLLEVMKKYSSILLYIDVHRDAISYKSSTVNIDGVECAKIMFVVGQEYDTYLKNLKNVTNLNDRIKEKYPTLSRGVLEKSGKGVNGVYNQDVDENVILIEIGGNENNIQEVLNTIELIAPIMGEYVNEKR